jgi:hypothetical protein
MGVEIAGWARAVARAKRRTALLARPGGDLRPRADVELVEDVPDVGDQGRYLDLAER